MHLLACQELTRLGSKEDAEKQMEPGFNRLLDLFPVSFRAEHFYAGSSRLANARIETAATHGIH